MSGPHARPTVGAPSRAVSTQFGGKNAWAGEPANRAEQVAENGAASIFGGTCWGT